MPEKNQVNQTLQALTEFFNSDIAEQFVSAMAKLNAHYYKELIKNGVPDSSAAAMAANFKGPGDLG